MQPRNIYDEPVGPIEDFEPGRLHELLGRQDVDHVRVFRRSPEEAAKKAKNRQRNKSARKMRAKQRKR